MCAYPTTLPAKQEDKMEAERKCDGLKEYLHKNPLKYKIISEKSYFGGSLMTAPAFTMMSTGGMG